MADAVQDFLQIIRVAFERGHLTPRSLLVSGAALALLIRLVFKRPRPRYISNLDKVGRRVGSNRTARDEKWEYDIIIVGGGMPCNREIELLIKVHRRYLGMCTGFPSFRKPEHTCIAA